MRSVPPVTYPSTSRPHERRILRRLWSPARGLGHALAWALLLLWSTAAVAAPPALTTDEQKTLYALGLALRQSLSSFTLTEAELAFVIAGLTDGVLPHDHQVGLQT